MPANFTTTQEVPSLIRRIRSLIIFLIVFSVSVFLGISIVAELENLQRQCFSTPETLYFTSGVSIIYIFIYPVSAFIGAYIAQIIKLNRKMFVVAISIFLVLLLIEINNFYDYAYITPQGMGVRTGILGSERYYSWSQLQRVDYWWHYSSGKSRTIIRECMVTLDDGSTVDLWVSKDSRPVLYSIFTAHDIPIVRQPISPDDYKTMMSMSHENPDQVNDVMLKIFPYSGPEVVFSNKPVSKGQLLFNDINAETDSDLEPNSIILPVMADYDIDDFIYISVGQTFLKVKDLNGDVVGEINFPQDKKFNGPVVITIADGKVVITLNGVQKEIHGIKALSGKIYYIGITASQKYE